MLSVILRCPRCGWQTTCGREELAKRLRTLGLLRRAPNPPEDLLQELLPLHISRLICDECGEPGLATGTEPQELFEDDWQQAVVCQVCRQPIDPERLEVYPSAQRCVQCQDAEDRGLTPVEVDYCSRCGAVLELRVSRSGGVTRYKQFCTGNPACRL